MLELEEDVEEVEADTEDEEEEGIQDRRKERGEGAAGGITRGRGDEKEERVDVRCERRFSC